MIITNKYSYFSNFFKEIGLLESVIQIKQNGKIYVMEVSQLIDIIDSLSPIEQIIILSDLIKIHNHNGDIKNYLIFLAAAFI